LIFINIFVGQLQAKKSFELMTKEKLAILLRNPVKTGDAADELNCLIEEYPYFHAGHMLYVKSLQLTSVEKLELQLSKSALNVRDRELLYNYLYVPEIIQKEEKPEEEQKEIEKEEEIEEQTEEEKVEIEEIPPCSSATQLPLNEKNSPGDLIDSFLKADTKIVPGNSQYEVDLSESMQESNEFITETLADIYAMQGYKNKAIEIYEQLILKYPEKHIYFAAQIKRLK